MKLTANYTGTYYYLNGILNKYEHLCLDWDSNTVPMDKGSVHMSVDHGWAKAMAIVQADERY